MPFISSSEVEIRPLTNMKRVHALVQWVEMCSNGQSDAAIGDTLKWVIQWRSDATGNPMQRVEAVGSIVATVGRNVKVQVVRDKKYNE